MRGAAARVLAHRSLPLLVALLAILFALPALGVGWAADDYFHRIILLEDPRYRELLGGPWEMFRFFRGDPVRTGREIDLGVFPWWTDPTIKAEFLQVLTVLTHRLDYALWPSSPVLMHAHSLLWLGAAVGAAAVFYRRILGAAWVAGVAALLFALDDARGATVGFLANRNALVAATFGISALIAHDHWRRARAGYSAVLAPLLLAAALFSKEEGIGTCAYLAAYGLFADPSGRWRGCLALVPYAVVVVAWRTVRDSWGFGVRNVGFYLDPLTDAVGYTSALPVRVPVLLLGQWSPLPAEVSALLGPARRTGLAVAAVLFLVIVGSAILPLLSRDRMARFFAAGMLLAALPVCATLPMDRLLTFVGLGASGLLALFWAFVFGGAQNASDRFGACSGAASRGSSWSCTRCWGRWPCRFGLEIQSDHAGSSAGFMWMCRQVLHSPTRRWSWPTRRARSTSIIQFSGGRLAAKRSPSKFARSRPWSRRSPFIGSTSGRSRYGPKGAILPWCWTQCFVAIGDRWLGEMWCGLLACRPWSRS